jgi:hypothetical protein
MIDDPLSLLMQGIWLLAAGMLPLGFVFGVCSQCCGCPWILGFNRCMVVTSTASSPRSGNTQRQSLRRLGSGDVQYMGQDQGSLQIHNVQSQIVITVRVSLSASGLGRTPIGEKRLQVWRFNRPNPVLATLYDVLGPAWHLEVETSVTGVATQAEAGVNTSIGVDSAGQVKLFVFVNQWTSNITHDESIALFPVGVQRWGPGISGTQSFRLTSSAVNATLVSGTSFSGWAVSKLAGMSIAERELAVRLRSNVFLNEGNATQFLNGLLTLSDTETSPSEYTILPDNVLCGRSDANVGIAIGVYPKTLTLSVSPSYYQSLPAGTILCEAPEEVTIYNELCGSYVSTYNRYVSHIRTYSGILGDFFCGDILWNIINGPCRSSRERPPFGTVSLQPRSLGDYDGGIAECGPGTSRFGSVCVDTLIEVTFSPDVQSGEASATRSARVSFLRVDENGGIVVTYETRTPGAPSNAPNYSLPGTIVNPCGGGSVAFNPQALYTEAGSPTGINVDATASASYSQAGSAPAPSLPQYTFGPCSLTSVLIDGVAATNNVSIAALTAGQCVYRGIGFTTAHQCGAYLHSVPCGCVPQVDVVSGDEYAQVTYFASGDKMGLIEIVAKSDWLGGQGVTFTVTCGTDSITHTVRRAATTPLAPVLLSVTRGPCSDALLQWSIEWDGGQPITAYTVQFRRIGVTAWTTFGTVAPPALSALVTGLVRVGYEFRVSATNSVGTSAFSNIVADGFALAAPTGLTVVRTPPCTSAQLSWTPPAQAECVVVAAYKVEFREIGVSAWTVAGTFAQATATVTGLTAGTRYQFIVASIDEAGVERFSGSAFSGLLPLVPTNVTPSLGINPGEVDLAWSHNAPEPCFPATDFNVQFRPSTTTTWSDVSRPASTDTFTTVTGLTQGVSYFFRVRAVNSVGNSSYSTQSSSILIPLPE